MRYQILLTAVLAATLSVPAAHGAAKKAKPARAYAAAPATLAQCSWDRPGRNPFMGDVVAAVDRYSDIPAEVRERLKARMRERNYDDMVDIRRDSIVGKYAYQPDIREMHFGNGRVCTQVSRKKWTERTHERGLVYCEGKHCILVPTVCRNVARIARRDTDVAGGGYGFMGPIDPREGGLGYGEPAGTPAPISSSTSEAVAGETVTPGSFAGGAAPLEGAGPIAGAFGFIDPVGSFVPPGGSGGNGVVFGVSEEAPGAIPAIPEPSTWAGMAGGLLAMLGFVAWRQRRTGAPRCATQKRS